MAFEVSSVPLSTRIRLGRVVGRLSRPENSVPPRAASTPACIRPRLSARGKLARRRARHERNPASRPHSDAWRVGTACDEPHYGGDACADAANSGLRRDRVDRRACGSRPILEPSQLSDDLLVKTVLLRPSYWRSSGVKSMKRSGRTARWAAVRLLRRPFGPLERGCGGAKRSSRSCFPFHRIC